MLRAAWGWRRTPTTTTRRSRGCRPRAAQPRAPATVPVALARCDATGSAIERGTDGRSPRGARRLSASSHRVVEQRRRRGCCPLTSSTSRPRRLSSLPVDRSSSATTSCPAASSRRQRFAPMNPAPPVTRTFTIDQGTRPVACLCAPALSCRRPTSATRSVRCCSTRSTPTGSRRSARTSTRSSSEFAAFVGVPDAAALSSGTAALHLALMMLGVGPGDEVLVPTLTFVATANAVVYVGARPVFVDSEPRHLEPRPRAASRTLLAERARRPMRCRRRSSASTSTGSARLGRDRGVVRPLRGADRRGRRRGAGRDATGAGRRGRSARSACSRSTATRSSPRAAAGCSWAPTIRR